MKTLAPLALVLCLGAAPAQATPFVLVDEAPVVGHDLSPEPPGRFADPGAVLVHDGVYHMFHNNFSNWPGVVGVYHATSPDGVAWAPAGDAPVFDASRVPWDPFLVFVTNAHVEEDGSWVLFFHTLAEADVAARSVIGRATAPGPDGPWTVDEAPLLEPGPEGSWDALAVRGPSVVRDGDRWLMFYEGLDGLRRAVGLATSEDGTTWAKHDDPATAEARLAASDPVFEARADGWDRYYVHRPRVQRTPDGLVMLYRGTDGDAALGLATSDDGLRWERLGDDPVLGGDELNPGDEVYFVSLLWAEGAYLAYLELGSVEGTAIYLARHEGPL